MELDLEKKSSCSSSKLKLLLLLWLLHLLENVGSGGNDLRQIIFVIVNPHLIPLRHDRLSFHLIIGLHCRIIMRRPIAKDPNTRFVIEIGLDIQTANRFLGSIG